eukprot:4619236-Amphidinium_carterae.1
MAPKAKPEAKAKPAAKADAKAKPKPKKDDKEPEDDKPKVDGSCTTQQPFGNPWSEAANDSTLPTGLTSCYLVWGALPGAYPSKTSWLGLLCLFTPTLQGCSGVRPGMMRTSRRVCTRSSYRQAQATYLWP